MRSQEDSQTFSDRPALDRLTDYRPRYLSIPATRLAVEPGTFLFQIGDRPDGIYIHKSGVARTFPLTLTRDRGRHPTGVEYVYGLAETLSAMNFGFSLRSITRSEFDFIDGETFIEFISQRPELIHRVNAAFSRIYRSMIRAITKQL